MKFIKNTLNEIYNIFLWASGAQLDILEEVPSEKNKFYGIGGTIVFTALMASFAGGYAFFTAFKSMILSVFFGAFWGALIFNLDRYIVSTFGVGDGKKTISRQEMIEATPRLIMAILLGFVIAVPLELKLFEREINTEIEKLNKEAVKKLEEDYLTISNETFSDWSEEIITIQKSVNFRDSMLKVKRDEYSIANKAQQDEWLGRGRTGKRGKGELWEELNTEKKRIYDELKAKESLYDTLNQKERIRLEELQGLVNNYKKSKIEDIESYKSTQEKNDGLMARLNALDSLTKDSYPLKFARWLITLLFVFIEIAPILFKMMTERGPYDDIIDRIKHEVRVKELLKQSNLNQEINTLVKIQDDKTKQKLNAELEGNKELILEIASAQAEIASVAIQKWKEEQIDLVKKDPSIIISARNYNNES